jgi:hypothetical protein
VANEQEPLVAMARLACDEVIAELLLRDPLSGKTEAVYSVRKDAPDTINYSGPRNLDSGRGLKT